MNRREKLFLMTHKANTGHVAISEPGSMKFVRNGIRTSYRPDFYCAECGVHFEVVGSRQAFHQNRMRIEFFRAAYPMINLKTVCPDGSEYGWTGKTRNKVWKTCHDPEKRSYLSFRLASRSRLKDFCSLNGIDIGALSARLGLNRATVYNVLTTDRVPHQKTATRIHEYLDSIEPESKTA